MASSYPSRIYEYHFGAVVDQLLSTSVAESTLQTYNRGLSSFHQFRLKFGFDNVWPVPVFDIMCFIANSFQNGLSHSTINCYLAGISFFSKINNHEDNTQNFVVRKMLEGIKRTVGSPKDGRLPITRDLLKRIIMCLPSVCKSNYEAKLFGSAFSLCFHAFLRVGEIAVSKGNVNHVISHQNVKLFQNNIELLLVSSKTDQTAAGAVINVLAQPDKEMCPLSLLKSYLFERPPYVGPLFCHFDGSPLTRYQISSLLTKSLKFLGVDPSCYSTHSIRIGAATTCCMEGVQDDQIMELGRWKSHSAYKRYIRIPAKNL